MNAEIIAVGSEMLTPFFQDTNSLFLTDKLNSLGVEVIFKTLVGDQRDRLACAARVALGRADLVILMGGLGPTEDDLTREAVAQVLEREIHRDPAIIAELYTRFAARRRPMLPNNERQADIIDGAVILPNPNGTAPGQWIQARWENQDKLIVLLPGPPREMKPMFEEQCLPRLKAALPAQFIASRLLKIAMMPESDADHRAAPIYQRYPDVQTTILATQGEIQFHLRCRAASQEEAQARVDALADEMEEELEDHVYSATGESLEQIVGYYLQMRQATLAVAESCTGGLLGQRITSVSGASRYFLGGAIVYSDELKTLFANIPPMMIAQHGAVSREVAAALAEGIREECRATLGVGITGVAGPTGGSDEKPVGLVYHALASDKGTDVIERRYPMGDRDRIRWFATQQALDMIRRKLM